MIFSSIAIGVVFVGMSMLFGQSSASLGTEFADNYHHTEGAVLLDVRTPAEFASGHLTGARNIDFYNPAFVSELRKLDKNASYFVYCRSGSRSGQTLTLMKKEGFAKVTDLTGGIASHQDLFALFASSTEYHVDPSDMVNAQELVGKGIAVVLTEAEKNGLILMREEEKLARDVYTTLGAQWNVNVFSNIAKSEQTHTDAIKVLLEKYSIPDPSTDDTVGVFRSPLMQKLYTDLTAQGRQSLSDALVVGATIEDLDIRDLDLFMAETQNEDILATYRNLQKGSRNHMRAFVKNITKSGETYTPRYISYEDYSAIISAPQERGRI